MCEPDALSPEPKGFNDACVVAQGGVTVQRQVIGGEVDVVVEEHAQALAQHWVYHARVLVPEQAVMHDHQASVPLSRSFK